MAPIGQGHAAAVNGLTETFVLVCGGRAIVSPRNPFRLNRQSEPQPDLMVLRRRDDFCATGATLALARDSEIVVTLNHFLA